MSDARKDREYVPRAAEKMFIGPSGFGDVKLHGFVVKADSTLLDDVLTRYIDRPSQELGLRVEVETAFDHVLFLFVQSKRFQKSKRRATGRLASQGSHGEHLFAIVVFGTETHPNPGPIAFAPYVYATLTPGWRTEREIFGYPQQLAVIPIKPDEPGWATSLKVEASAIKEFRSDAIAEKMTILKLEKKAGGSERQRSPDQLGEDIANAIAGSKRASAGPTPRRGHRDFRSVMRPRGRFGVTAADIEFFKRSALEAPDPDGPRPADGRRAQTQNVDLVGAFQTGLRMLFLKQFRDIVFADRACFQAIVETRITARYKPTTAWTSTGYELTLEELDSAPIGRELGVPLGKSDVALAFRVEFEELSIGDKNKPATVVSNPLRNSATETPSPKERPRLPKYVERGGDAVWRQPSMLYGARIYGFGVRVDVSHQEKMLDHYVNKVVRRCGVNYGPAKFLLSPCHGVDMVMLMFVEYTRVASGTDDDSRLGGVSYREFLVTQLGFYDDLDFPEINWLIPFIYLDQDSPRLGGREIYGYPKQLGVIPPFTPFPAGGLTMEAAKELTLQTTVMARTQDADARELKPIVTVSGNAPPKTLKQYSQASDMIVDLLSECTPAVQAGPQAGRLFASSLPGLVGSHGFGPGVNLVNALVSGGVGHVFLKQFRDSTVPRLPCYQAVCKTDTVPGKFRGGARVDRHAYTITIGNFASERLLKYLDLKVADGKRGIKPDFAYWMDLDVELTTGRVIANSFETGSVPDRTNPDPRERGAQRRVRRTGELAL